MATWKEHYDRNHIPGARDAVTQIVSNPFRRRWVLLVMVVAVVVAQPELGVLGHACRPVGEV